MKLMKDVRRRLRLLLAVTLVALFFCSYLSAQCGLTGVAEKPIAVKLAEVGKVSRGAFERQWRQWVVLLKNNPTAELYIINYGTDVEI